MSTRRARWIAAVVVIVALVGGAFVARDLLFSGAAVKKLTRQQSIANSIFTLINAQRKASGLPPFKRDPVLDRLAQAHSHDMLVKNYFAHDAPASAGGVTFAERFHSISPRRPLGEENIAYGGGSYGTAQGLVTLWMHSPPHRENILNPAVHRIGIGISIGLFQGQPASTIGTQDFSN